MRAKASLSNEHQLILLSCRLEIPEKASGEVSHLVEAGLDWDRVLKLAKRHQVTAFLAYHLGARGLGNKVPSETWKSLKNSYEESRIRFVYYVEPELRRALSALADESIPVIPLKGAALNRLVYQDVALRSVGDLDLLFREQDLDRAYQHLGAIGYREQRTPPGHERTVEDYHFCPRLLSPDGAIEIEMHRHVVSKSSPMYFDIEAVWDRAIEREVAGVTVRAQAPQDLLTHLCLTFFLDRYHIKPSLFALRQLVDISEVARFYADDLEWNALVEYWEDTGLAGPVQLSLCTSWALLGYPEIQFELSELGPDEFSDGLFESFLERKVLGEGPWFFHELVEPADNRPWNITKAAARRLCPQRRYLELEYPRLAVDEGAPSLYRRHLENLAGATATALRKPQSFKQHLQVDRWMHRLQLSSRSGSLQTRPGSRGSS